MNEASSLPLDVVRSNASSLPATPSPPHVTPTNNSLHHHDDNDYNNNPLSDTITTPTRATIAADTAAVFVSEEEEPPPVRDSSCVQVAVRVRPSLPGEAKDCVISVDTERSAVQVYGDGGPRFTFDKVLPPTVSQSTVFDTVVQPLVVKTLQGYNATIFAYGQTGSGKTYTILGPAEAWMGSSTSVDNASQAPTQRHHAPSTGLLPRAVYALFDGLAAQQPAALAANEAEEDANANGDTYSYTVTLQFLEVYGDEIRDLLGHGIIGQNKLTVREYHDEPEVVGAECITCPTAAHAIKAVAQGTLRRVTAATAMNATSSRSHALLTVGIRQEWRGTDDGGDSDNGNNSIVKQSKFHFCDLAGSERQKRTQAEGQRLKEGIHINQGLLVLGNVISALASQSFHVPYRDSKLTRLLRGSLGGNHQTLMIACVAGNQVNVDESINCLRYANRAKNIRNSAVVNLDANSKRLLELQSHIVGLAQSLELVLSAVAAAAKYNTSDDEAEEEIKENIDWPAILAQIPYSREALQMMVAGGQSQVRDIDKSSATTSSVRVRSPTKSSTVVMASSPPNQSAAQHQSSPTPRTPREDYRLHEMEGRIRALERELLHTQKRLDESQEYHDAAEVELHRYRALERIMGTVSSSTDPSDPAAVSTITESSFLEQATAYEQEISFLRKELQTAERKANRFAVWQNANPQQEEQRLQAAEALLQRDQLRLRQLQSTATVEDSSSDRTMPPTIGGMASSDLLDEEVQAEQADLQKMTQKYLAQGGHVDDDENADEGEEVFVATTASSVGSNDITTGSSPTLIGLPMEIKHLHLENDLLALSKSIDEREGLIRELKENQEKFASMREFYEEKLSKMEAELLEKEQEREQLAQQLETAKTRGSTQDIQNRLREKDRHIDALRRKQMELRNLTNVSHRNELDIARLQNDVAEMKRKRVDMQKQLAAERKQHAVEVKELQKTATQKEREIHKLQKISNQREMQAQKAGQVAKARLEELNALRAKNREVEKKLRMQTVKRGMMQKAGIDSVLVGQRVVRQNTTQSGKLASTKLSKVDVDQLQVLFDKKISDVVQREALADKLAEEWEQHYDLTEKKQELLASDSQEAEEDLQALSMKIGYKQNRIRQLAKKLGKESQTGRRKSDGDYDLFDEHFRRLCKDSPPEEAQKTLARVLFGMVVKERRRISALARTASSLDEKLQKAEKMAEEKEIQLRSYMDEHKYLAAELSHTQQKNILSLMEMVKLDRLQGSAINGVDEMSRSDETKLLVLANERIAVLENQIEQLQSHSNRDTNNSLQSSDVIADMRRSLEEARSQRAETKRALETTFNTLRIVRERLLSVFLSVDANGDRENLETALDLVNGMVSQTKNNGDETQNKEISTIRQVAPYFQVQEEYEETPDEPDWAIELMEDLEFIAEGKIPPSLQDLPGFAEQVANFDNMTNESNSGSVWDRLTNPDNFTGTQKRKKKPRKIKKPQLHSSRMVPPAASEISPKVFPSGGDQTSDLSSTPVNSTEVAVNVPGPTTERKMYKSVFDRLISPSQATGTQRQRLTRKNESDDCAEHGDEAYNPNEDVDRFLDDTLGESSKSEAFHQTEHPRDEEESYDVISSLSPMSKEKRSTGGHYTEYAEQDVFERLQRTSTVSSQNRLGSNFSEGVSADSIKTMPQSNQQKGGQVHVTANTDSIEVQSQTHLTNHHHDDTYTSLDVFERLQKTTTEAYAKKVNKPRD